jgi:hypothetical protein
MRVNPVRQFAVIFYTELVYIEKTKAKAAFLLILTPQA